MPLAPKAAPPTQLVELPSPYGRLLVVGQFAYRMFSGHVDTLTIMYAHESSHMHAVLTGSGCHKSKNQPAVLDPLCASEARNGSNSRVECVIRSWELKTHLQFDGNHSYDCDLLVGQYCRLSLWLL